MPDNPADKSSDAVSSASSRILILESLVPLAVEQVGEQATAMIDRLTEALFRLSDQSVRPAEANLSFNAWNHLKKNATQLQRGIVGSLGYALLREIAALDKGQTPVQAMDSSDLSLVSLEEMENKVLIGNIGQAIELNNSAALVALNIRISRLLQREEISISQNPFRPGVFLRAVFEAWCKFDPIPESHRLALRLLRPEVFLDFEPILEQLNGALVARGIVPDLVEAYRAGKVDRRAKPTAESERRDLSLHNKLQRWLQNGPDGKGGGSQRPDRRGAAGPTTPGTINNALLDYLTDIQRNAVNASGDPGGPAFSQTAATLRHIPRQAPSGSMSAMDQNTIELLARIFDFVFSDHNIPDEIKGLLGQLQVPLLKTALIDKEFFFSDTHPARRLLERLAQSGLGLRHDTGADDPLYKIIEQIVDRVQQEFDQHLGLYSEVVADLEAFITEEEKTARSALKTSISEALREEKMRQAQEAAENDVAVRIETGEIAGFVEIFLETQWVRILTLAHSVAERKPQALEKALKAMDDLIWTVKPKVSPEERKELVNKLPSLLSLLNAWLNAIKWDEPERVEFFANLVERHAAMVRVPTELTPGHQIEIAVNVAQKASERRLSKRAREMQEKPIDQFVHVVDSIELGTWVEFVRNNGVRIAFRLAWISPLRSRFIFSNRQGDDPFSFTAGEFASALREQGAVVMPRESVVTRALTEALKGAAPDRTDPAQYQE